MNAEYYILIGLDKKGPFTAEKLKSEFKLSQNTLLWKEGLSDWNSISHFSEFDLITNIKT